MRSKSPMQRFVHHQQPQQEYLNTPKGQQQSIILRENRSNSINSKITTIKIGQPTTSLKTLIKPVETRTVKLFDQRVKENNVTYCNCNRMELDQALHENQRLMKQIQDLQYQLQFQPRESRTVNDQEAHYFKKLLEEQQMNYEEEISSLQNSISEYKRQSEVATYSQSKIGELNDEIARLKNQVTYLTQLTNEKQLSIDCKDNTISNQINQIQQLEQQANNLEEEVQEQNRQVRQYESDFEEQKERIRKYEDKMDVLSIEIKKLNQLLQKKNDEINQLNIIIDQTTAQTNTKVKFLEQKLHSLQEQLSIQQADLEEKDQYIQQLLKELGNNQFESECQKKHQQIQDLNDQLESERGKHKKEKDDLESERKLGEKKLADEVEKLKEELQEKDKVIAQLEQDLDVLQSNSTDSLNCYIDKISILSQEIDRLTMILKEKEQVIKELREQLEKQEKEKDVVCGELCSLEGELKAKGEKVQQLERQVYELQGGKLECESRIQRLEEELQEALEQSGESEQVREELVESQERVTFLNQELETWKNKFIKLNREFHQVQEDLMMSQAEFDAYKQRQNTKEVVVSRQEVRKASERKAE